MGLGYTTQYEWRASCAGKYDYASPIRPMNRERRLSLTLPRAISAGGRIKIASAPGKQHKGAKRKGEEKSLR